jgi:protein tyrosine/serine phosphatase
MTRSTPTRSTPTRRAVIAAALVLLPLASRRSAAAGRPPTWATPVALDGAPNLHRVEDNLFRSAQPNGLGFKNLAATLGVRTVVSLRAFNPDEALAAGVDLQLVRYPIHTWNIRRAYVVAALQTLRRASRAAPVLLHCQHGADRTGLVSALYRILYQDWDKAAALDEMQNGRFGYHAVWGNIPRFIRRVDVARLRRDVDVA